MIWADDDDDDDVDGGAWEEGWKMKDERKRVAHADTKIYKRINKD